MGRLSVDLEHDEHKDLKRMALDADLPMAEYIRKLIREAARGKAPIVPISKKTPDGVFPDGIQTSRSDIKRALALVADLLERCHPDDDRDKVFVDGLAKMLQAYGVHPSGKGARHLPETRSGTD